MTNTSINVKPRSRVWEVLVQSGRIVGAGSQHIVNDDEELTPMKSLTEGGFSGSVEAQLRKIVTTAL